MDTENILFQTTLLVIAIAYKYLLARENVWGWILSATSSILSCLYVFIYFKLPILISLELCFMSLSLYGIYKYVKNLAYLTRIDFIIIALTMVAIIYFVFKQLETKTVWYEIAGSVTFLSGVVFMAQKNRTSKMIAWINFILGSLFIGVVVFQKHAYILLLLHIISVVIGCYAIKRLKITSS
ncbi:hypothetical protein A3J61_00125 [Candidatus Nomurabacteria bacterium RIFCSPHIGHO2_02_FULL_38_15]|uniref:Nicotinamide mononucleotide transporter PnuC n=1 Tax=Candidatus Nomurabacteria bacterium RIFCSPHIGHO2_02_FULL_38_15 TaxID=1801752 RepID=A0A1F6VQ89_9BACT|nr:MAG: hypothetical protein A3J61_00125 [Candidatus Nomurabacteria bacterium RIFCSPHIGHO2_02_FULL_38_15]